MDYFIGFIFGYCLKNFFSWLRNLSFTNNFIDDRKIARERDVLKDLEDWDWILNDTRRSFVR